MENVSEKLRCYFSDRGITQIEIAQRMNVTKAYVNSIFSGRKNIGRSTAKKFSDIYGLSETWLLTGEGSMLKEPGFNGVPEYDKDFSCGNAVMYNDSAASVVGSLSMAEYANATAIVRATGNSMHPLISSGDKVIIKEVENWPENIIYGQIYGVETDGDIRTIKRVRRSSEEGIVILEPVNKDEYDNTPIQAAQITKMWLVLGCIKQFV